MDRATKLRRLNAFRRNKSFCSAVVLAQILKDIKDNGLPDLIDRHAMREARDFITMSSEGGYGPILRQVECRSIDGYPLILNVADPFATLTKAIEESSTFRAFLKTRLWRSATLCALRTKPYRGTMPVASSIAATRRQTG